MLEEKINLDQETNPNDIFDSTESLLDAVVVYDEENQEMEQEDVPGSSENFSLISGNLYIFQSPTKEQNTYLIDNTMHFSRHFNRVPAISHKHL